jgi:PPP family 3-phenylpropionic acid transporter
MEQFSRPPRLMTAKYSVAQSAYWMAICGLTSFAATYLQMKGFTASSTGIILALVSLLSCAIQPFVAAFADRTARVPLIFLISGTALISCLCMTGLLALPLRGAAFAAVYLLGALTFDSILPLLNAVAVYYTDRGAPINYGVGRGIGSLMFGVSSLVIGKAIEKLGADVMPVCVIALIAVYIAVMLTFPVARRGAGSAAAAAVAADVISCTVPEFFRRYKWFCATLGGILLMGSFHAMTENYMINVMGRLGGGSGNVGIALAIATILEVPVFFWFAQIQKRLTTPLLLKIASLTFLLKALGLLSAKSIGLIYLVEILQTTSYGFCSPAQVYFASERIAPRDMVKGQAFATASYALGCALGNFLGGQIIQFSGVTAMLWAGVALAAAAVAVIFLTVGKVDEASLATTDR